MGEFKGSLTDGITITVGFPGIISGSLTLYVNEERVLHLKGTLEIYTKEYTFDIPLFPIPFARYVCTAIPISHPMMVSDNCS